MKVRQRRFEALCFTAFLAVFLRSPPKVQAYFILENTLRFPIVYQQCIRAGRDLQNQNQEIICAYQAQ